MSVVVDYFALAVANARDEFAPAIVQAAIAADADEMDAAVSAPPASVGPTDCCADCAWVVFCDNVTDTWECPLCGYRWTAPCR